MTERARRARVRRRGVALCCACACAVTTSACAPVSPSAAPGKAARVESCEYDVTVAKARPLVLDVRARCEARGPLTFVASEQESAPHLRRVRDGMGRSIPRRGRGFFTRESAPGVVEIRYQLDLDAVARDADSFDVALRSGRTLVAPASTWLLKPEPHGAGAPVTVDVRESKEVSFVTGLTRVGGKYCLDAHEIPVSTYAVFGAREIATHTLEDPAGRPAQLTIAFADAVPRLGAQALSQWLLRSSQAVARFWGGFPVERALVVVLPAPGRKGVVFGKVLPESSPGVVIVVGEESDEQDLKDDWVLVHELFHLGFPSFVGEAKWLDEGLATYYEPIIRARVGNKTEQDVWAEFARAMPQGLSAMRNEGLENTQSFRSIYWGGALVALLADVELRRKKGVGLEVGLRSVLRSGGNASEVWSLDKTVSVIDDATSSSVLDDLVQRYAHKGSKIDLQALWSQLGVVEQRGGVRLRDDAPLAHVRRAVVFGRP